MQPAKQSRLSVLAVSEWVMVLPATVFLAAAALRELQPRQYEPSHTSWIIFEWTMQHVSRLGAGILFLGLPALALMIGCGLLAQKWHGDDMFRQDAIVAFSALRRHIALALVTVATALAAAIFLFTVVRIFTD
ncbi:MAG TPA: hypothetical protein VGR36_10130 [Candidatus Acidoferrales bacterium]|nr:hypothetical protein [Candidatus Acidoferrales bacterium]